MLFTPEESSLAKITTITSSLQANFVISPWLLLPALLVIVLAVKRMPPIPSLFAGVLAGAATAMLVQGAGLHDVFTYGNSGYSIDTGVSEIDSLLNRGGIQSMMWTISLVLIALGFGGALEKTRCLESIVAVIINKVRGFSGIQTAVISTSVATNLVAGDPYLSIALPGRMYAPVYRGMGYSTLNLSRAIEEGGTLISPLIPWNAGGAFVISALGLGIADGQIENLMYIPLAFACWLSPVIGIIYAYTGLFSPRASETEIKGWKENAEVVTDLGSVDWVDDQDYLEAPTR
jgi:NhaC family Na+:H+ antiporter